MTSTSTQTTYLKDYKAPEFEILTTDLVFYLGEEITTVESTLRLQKKFPDKKSPLILQGSDNELLSLSLNDNILNPQDYILTSETLTFNDLPNTETFTLRIKTQIKPQLNTHLEGLYKVKNLFCTQCEAEGFRKITYYLDRSDVMSKFTTTIIADKTKYPILLSNGNLIESKLLENNLHLAKWQDPFKKPCYLFALVAGNLACVETEYVTQFSKRKITIKLYVDHGDEDKTAYALESVKQAMKWDEDNFGREYDLDIFMIVSTHDFNMGAMENKGLNIFNSKYILANPQTATDDDYMAIQRVIGHEYFHNWTGNRITCRDWFQLSLKEGLTVFRDSRFSADMTSAAVVRINDVNTLRSVQFPQDAGPMAHPVQPQSYIEINNFYTVTIYEKGAEIIHMLYSLLGKENFRKGMDCYFERNDGKAVCIEDFVQAHADANHKDLSQFLRWYKEAGTPEVFVTTKYDAAAKKYEVTFKQKHPSHQPFYMPFKIGLLDNKGQDLLTDKQGHCELHEINQNFIFDEIVEKPVISLLRDFSAPVKFYYDYTDQELAFLLQHDSDSFARWNAGQELSLRIIRDNHQESLNLYINALKNTCEKYLENSSSIDPAFLALLLTLPNEHYLIERTDCTINNRLDQLFESRISTRLSLAQKLQTLFLAIYEKEKAEDDIGKRALKNKSLAYMELLNLENIDKIITHQFDTAQNMTDRIAALSLLCNRDKSSPARLKALEDFYHQFESQPLVIDKWFALQARAENKNVLDTVKQLLNHPAFSMKNPNKVRSLIGAFSQNLSAFHEIDGSGYQFLTDKIIELNKINPMIAARLCEPLTRFRKYDAKRQNLIKNCLEKIKTTPDLAVDIIEIVEKSLSLS